MAHRTKINGTAYEIKGGRTKIGGTGYDIKKGRTKVGGTGYDIEFSKPITITLKIYQANKSFGSPGIFVASPQLVTIPAEEGMTYADLAANSEYNAFDILDSSGITGKISVYEGYPAVTYVEASVNDATAWHKDLGAADKLVLTDGMVVNIATEDPYNDTNWRIISGGWVLYG